MGRLLGGSVRNGWGKHLKGRISPPAGPLVLGISGCCCDVFFVLELHWCGNAHAEKYSRLWEGSCFSSAMPSGVCALVEALRPSRYGGLYITPSQVLYDLLFQSFSP